MDSKLENTLRKVMHAVGRVVESVIGHAKKAKGTVTPAHTVEPILAVESQLPLPKLKELISVSVERAVKPLVPNLLDKASLELGEGEMKFSPLMKEKSASVAVHVDIGGAGGAYPRESKPPGVHSIRAEIKSMPFEDGFFDFVVANLATPKQGDIVKAIKEVGRLSTLGGQGVIVDFHPFGRFAKRGSARLRSIESTVKGVEDYYKICKVAGLSISYIREAFFDETVRTHFETPEEKSAFRSIKDTPFLIFLVVSKKGR